MLLWKTQFRWLKCVDNVSLFNKKNILWRIEELNCSLGWGKKNILFLVTGLMLSKNIYDLISFSITVTVCRITSSSYYILLFAIIISTAGDAHNCLVLHYNTPMTLMDHDRLWILWLSRWYEMTALSAAETLAFLGQNLTVHFSDILAALWSFVATRE